MGITTDTSQFKKGLDTASSSLGSFQSTLMKAAGAFAVFETGRAIIDKVASSIRGIADTADIAGRIGLTSEAFNKLSYAAKLSGIDQDALATSLEQMQKRLGEVAITGEGPAAQALMRFGLSARNLATMGADKSLEVLLGVLRGIQNPAERSAIAMELFGKSGAKMISLASAGAGALREMGDEAGKVGFALNAIDSAKVEEADDAMDKFNMALQGVWNTLVVQLVPYITAASEAIVEFVKNGTAVSAIGTALSVLAAPFKLAINFVQTLRVGFLNLGAEGVNAFASILDGINALTGQFGETATKMHRLAESMRADAAALWKQGSATQNIEEGATKRAQAAAAKTAAFAAPGAFSTPAKVEPKFGGASELGSKEAYSSIVRSMGVARADSEQKKIAENTRRNAGAAERGVALLEKIAGMNRDLKPNMPGAF